MPDASGYEEARTKAQKLYSETKTIYCPALGENVHFTAEGFNHLMFKGPRLEREHSDQLSRFKLLEHAILLIQTTTIYQEFEEVSIDREIKWHRKRILRPVITRYWGLVGIIGNRKVRVVIRKIGNGAAHFLSVMPAWKTTSHRDIKFMTTMLGNPEED